MKLRIRGNSIRLRLTQSEVARIRSYQAVEALTQFGPNPHEYFSYRLDINIGISRIQASYSAQTLTVTLPKHLAEKWSSSDQISLEAEQAIDGKEVLEILIEKDFFCLKPRSSREEDESDMYANPNGACR